MFSFFNDEETAKNLQHLFSLYLLIKHYCFDEIARFNPRTNRIDTLCALQNNVVFLKTAGAHVLRPYAHLWTTNPNLVRLNFLQESGTK